MKKKTKKERVIRERKKERKKENRKEKERKKETKKERKLKSWEGGQMQTQMRMATKVGGLM